MSTGRLKAAQALIKQGDYEGARAILRMLPDDPTARRWLARLDAHITPLPDPEPNFQPLEDAPALRRTRWRLRWLSAWRWLWWLLALAALVWIGFGIYSGLTGSNPFASDISHALLGAINRITGTINEQVGTVNPELEATARDTGAAVSTGAAIAVFACSGLPLLLLFTAFYRRASRVYREERRHREVLETMQRRP